MAGKIGNLTVGLGLDAAEFSRGLSKAEAQAQNFTRSIAKGTFAGSLFADLAKELARLPGQFIGLVKGAIDAADKLNDLSKKTGVAVETLGGLGFAASQAGGDLDSTVAGLTKLNKTIAEAAAGNKQAKEFFDVLGISVRDSNGAIKDAGDVYLEVADKFEGFKDGANKTALAVRGLGKAGADQIAVLNEGGKALQSNIDYYKRYGGITTDTAKRADEFNDTLGKINLLSQSFGRTLASELLPPLQALADLWLKNKEGGDQFRGVASDIVTFLKAISVAAAYVVLTFTALGDQIGALLAKAGALARLDFKGFSAIGKDADANLAAARKRFDDFVKAINTENAKQNITIGIPTGGGLRDPNAIRAAGLGGKPDAPGLAGTGGSKGTRDDDTKKLLENRLKAIQDSAERERDVMESRNKFLDIFNDQGLLSIKEYYEGKRVAQSEGLKAEVAGYNQEIAVLERFRDTAGRSKKDRADTEGKIAELVDKRAKAEQQAGEAGIELGIREARAFGELQSMLVGVNAQVDELSENFARAAGTKFDQQFEALSRTFSAEGNQRGLDAIAILRDAAVSQGQFQEAVLATRRSLDELGGQEERIALAQQTGAATSLQALAAVGAARRAMIPILEAQVAAEEAIARASGSKTLIANAEQARLALEKLKAAADPLAESFNKLFEGQANSALADFVTGTKTASQAFKSFTKSVLDDILRLGSKSIAESLFGGSGGIGGFLSSLFGSGGGGSTGNGFGSIISSLFSGFFAEGGFIPPGQWGIAGENGPEPVYGGSTGQTVIPAGGKGGGVYNISVSVQAAKGVSTETALQQGRDIGVGIQQALQRNN